MEAVHTISSFGDAHEDHRELREARRSRLAAKVAKSAGMESHAELGMGGPMLRTGEVALLFGVSERCIRNWANAGKLPSVRTLGRHRLFPAKEVASVLRQAMTG